MSLLSMYGVLPGEQMPRFRGAYVQVEGNAHCSWTGLYPWWPCIILHRYLSVCYVNSIRICWCLMGTDIEITIVWHVMTRPICAEWQFDTKWSSQVLVPSRHHNGNTKARLNPGRHWWKHLKYNAFQYISYSNIFKSFQYTSVQIASTVPKPSRRPFPPGESVGSTLNARMNRMAFWASSPQIQRKTPWARMAMQWLCNIM